MTMNNTRSRIESTRRRARGTLRSLSGRATRFPSLYAKTWTRELAGWTNLAADVLDGCVGVGEAVSGMMALSLSGMQASVDLGKAACELIIHPFAPSGSGVVEFFLDADSQAADPVELDVASPVTASELTATDLRNVANPSGPSIPASHVRFTTPSAPSQPVLVSLSELGQLVPTLPDGTYEGKIRKAGTDVGTIRVIVYN
jgi:hypothetical protein